MGRCLPLLCAAIWMAGCASAPGPTPLSVAAAPIDPAAPLVLAIPGLNIPGEKITQENHFGDLVGMLAAEGIPARVLAYDTPRHPLTAVATLGFDKAAIAATRVSPAVINAIQAEDQRRHAAGLSPTGEVVLFSYSQGALIAHRVLQGIHSFKERYKEFSRLYGREWVALQRDPQFLSLMDSLQDFLVLHDMKVQRERDFAEDPDLMQVFSRAEGKLQKKTEAFLKYLHSPETVYPHIQEFEPPDSDKYPKRYSMLKKCANDCFTNQEEYTRVSAFFVDYAKYKEVLKIRFRFVATAGSFFGSPRANKVVGILEAIPILRGVVGRELMQIKDTRLGSTHQREGALRLLELKRAHTYPMRPMDALFLVGAQGEGGDGLVDQSSAHLSGHAFATARVPLGAEGRPADKTRRDNPAGADSRILVVVDRLPDLPVAPIPVRHFPRDRWPVGRVPGAAYMEEGHPALPYLLAFLRKDWVGLKEMLDESPIRLQQFMVQLDFEGIEKSTPSVRQVKKSDNILIQKSYRNREDNSVVWTGRFTADDQKMNLLGVEDDTGFVTFDFWWDTDSRFTVDIPVYPGCNTFLRLRVAGAGQDDGADERRAGLAQESRAGV